jgi:hypothetical protein
MHAWSQPLLISHSTKKGRQPIALLCAQRGQERVLVITGHTPNRFHRLAPLVREMQRIAPPIGGVRPALNQAAFLELVDQHHEPAWQNTQIAREGLLADPTGHVHEPQDAGVGRGEIDGGQALCELRRRMRADLRQEERGRVSAARWRTVVGGSGFGLAHVDKIISLTNNSLNEWFT